MAKIVRSTQKTFAGNLVAANNIAKFGSLKDGSPAYSLLPSDIQTTDYLNGWAAAVTANAAPALQDMNSLFYLLSLQLGYVLQTGVPEWDAGTTYYIGSLVQDGAGVIYASKTDANLNNLLTDTTKWRSMSTAPTVQKFLSGSGTYTTPTGVKYIRVRMVGGGGGGAGSADVNDNGGSGGNGGNTTFGTTLLVANGGGGGNGANSSTPAAGGTASLGTGPIGVALTGGSSQGHCSYSSSATVGLMGGVGASSPFGGAGAGQDPAGSSGSGAAIANTGSGGGGAGKGSGSTGGFTGQGGAAGGYVDAIIADPLTSYSYAVGAAGTAGSAGSSGNGGGAGGSGIIIVEEHYK
jgi:hypothetical protein